MHHLSHTWHCSYQYCGRFNRCSRCSLCGSLCYCCRSFFCCGGNNNCIQFTVLKWRQGIYYNCSVRSKKFSYKEKSKIVMMTFIFLFLQFSVYYIIHTASAACKYIYIIATGLPNVIIMAVFDVCVKIISIICLCIYFTQREQPRFHSFYF